MRLLSIQLSGFRGFATESELDLSADVTILSGPNGRGKTSLFDAVLWGLTGTLPRVDHQEGIVSRYSETGEARVALNIQDPAGGRHEIVRFTGPEPETQRVRYSSKDEGTFTGEEAARRICEVFWPGMFMGGERDVAFATLFTRSVYLQQDLLRGFLEADSDDARFSVLSELVGVGKVTELQHYLTSSKKSWTRATTPMRQELEDLKSRLAGVAGELERLKTTHQVSVDEAGMAAWWKSVRQLRLDIPEDSTFKHLADVEHVLRTLEITVRRRRARLADIRELADDLIEWEGSVSIETDHLRGAVDRASVEVSEAQEALENAERGAAERREGLARRRNALGELAALAELALRHLGDRCPVCTQEYDPEITRIHLRELLAAEAGPSEIDGTAAMVSKRAEQVTAAKAELRESRRALKEAEEAREERMREGRRLSERLKEFDIQADLENAKVAVQRLVNDTDEEVQHLEKTRTQGERISLALTQVLELERQKALERQLSTIQGAVEKLAAQISRRDKTGEVCDNLVSALRDREQTLVRQRIERMLPLLQRLCAKIDPHPTFRQIALAISMYYGKGRVGFELTDPVLSDTVGDPTNVLSSSQINALAVAIFLAVNLGAPSLPVQAILLDDPFQNLDDVNLLGLTDLLRRVRPYRQVIVSSHDERFAALLERKLRPLGNKQRSRVIEFLAWSRQGPSIRQRSIPVSDSRLRVVA